MELSRARGNLIEQFLSELPSSEMIDEWAVGILLVRTGAKLATEFHLLSPSAATPDQTPPISQDRREKTTNLLDELGLYHSELAEAVIKNGAPPLPYVRRIVIRIAATRENLAQMETVWNNPYGYPADARLHGRLSGFPQTAIRAFVADGARSSRIIDPSELPREVLESEAAAFSCFALSRHNWRDELATGQHWADIISENAPKLYARRMEYNSRLINEYLASS